MNSEITTDTSRAINLEISSQMSTKLEEIRIYVYSHILEAINSAIDKKVLPTIQNLIRAHDVHSNTKVDLRSDRLQQNIIVYRVAKRE